MDNAFDFDGGFAIDFELMSGLSHAGASTKRRLSQMAGMYADEAAFAASDGSALVYEFYELGAPERPGDQAFGTSITYPGRVGREFYMTKGHFHSILDTAEVYYCLSGAGLMLMENPEGDCKCIEMKPGVAAYVPRRYAHRSINIGAVPFVTFFVFRADAGHDYGTIETKGFRHVVLEHNGGYELAENPNW